MNLRPYLLASPRQIWVTKFILHLICLGYIGVMLFLAITDQLHGDPVDVLLHFTGIGAIHLLFVTLSISVVAKIWRIGRLIRIRRLLGIYSFVYAVLHVMVYLALELQFHVDLFLSEIVRRPYIVVGMIAVILLLLLTMTSPMKIQQWMGRHWQRLHRLVYLALILALIHFFWSQKTVWNDALLYWFAAITLLGIKWIKR